MQSVMVEVELPDSQEFKVYRGNKVFVLLEVEKVFEAVMDLLAVAVDLGIEERVVTHSGNPTKGPVGADMEDFPSLPPLAVIPKQRENTDQLSLFEKDSSNG